MPELPWDWGKAAAICRLLTVSGCKEYRKAITMGLGQILKGIRTTFIIMVEK